MLAHRNSFTAICKNMDSVIRLILPQVEILALPNIDYCRKYRGITCIILENYVVYRVVLSIVWSQVFFDKIHRKTIPFTIFATIIIEDNTLRSILLSCTKVGIDSISEDTVNAILRVLENDREYLIKYATTLAKLYPSEEYNIPLLIVQL